MKLLSYIVVFFTFLVQPVQADDTFYVEVQPFQCLNTAGNPSTGSMVDFPDFTLTAPHVLRVCADQEVLRDWVHFPHYDLSIKVKVEDVETMRVPFDCGIPEQGTPLLYAGYPPGFFQRYVGGFNYEESKGVQLSESPVTIHVTKDDLPIFGAVGAMGPSVRGGYSGGAVINKSDNTFAGIILAVNRDMNIAFYSPKQTICIAMMTLL